MTGAYYNEIDPYAAQWLRNLIAEDLIAEGEVDERDIADVEPNELYEFTQCHFFAGIGIWSLALRLAGWPDNRPVWTGSCPCQPFSAAGKGDGFADERHQWPNWHYLIEQCKPSNVFGEQVAGKDGLTWLDLVQADMEGVGYTCGAIVTPAAGFGAPNLRQRLYFNGQLANTTSERCERRLGQTGNEKSSGRRGPGFSNSCKTDRLGDSSSERLQGYRRSGKISDTQRWEIAERYRSAASTNGILENSIRDGRDTRCRGNGEEEEKNRTKTIHDHQRPSIDSELANTDGRYTGEERKQRSWEYGLIEKDSRSDDGNTGPGPVNGFWKDCDWLGSKDGNFRPVEPGTFPLANGHTNRMGKLRAYGNALNVAQATGAVEAFLEVEMMEGHSHG